MATITIEVCERCGGDLADDRCQDETCPFHDCSQNDPAGWKGHPDEAMLVRMMAPTAEHHHGCTTRPVEMGGWYELACGCVQHFRWERGLLVDGQIVSGWEHAGLARPAVPACPDGGACHHNCGTDGTRGRMCWRVTNASPLSGVYPDDQWPIDTAFAHRVSGAQVAISLLRDEYKLMVRLIEPALECALNPDNGEVPIRLAKKLGLARLLDMGGDEV